MIGHDDVLVALLQVGEVVILALQRRTVGADVIDAEDAVRRAAGAFVVEPSVVQQLIAVARPAVQKAHHFAVCHGIAAQHQTVRADDQQLRLAVPGEVGEGIAEDVQHISVEIAVVRRLHHAGADLLIAIRVAPAVDNDVAGLVQHRRVGRETVIRRSGFGFCFGCLPRRLLRCLFRARLRLRRGFGGLRPTGAGGAEQHRKSKRRA